MKLKHIALIGSLFPILFSLVLFFGVLISADSDDENSNFSSGITGMNLSAEVLKHQPMVEKYARENGISEYVNVLLAIIQVESGGTAEDVMQSSESLGLPPNSLDTESSIKQGCKYFASLLSSCKNQGIDDLNVAIQSYNYGGGYVGYVAGKGKKHTFNLAESFAREKSGGKKVCIFTIIQNHLPKQTDSSSRHKRLRHIGINIVYRCFFFHIGCIRLFTHFFHFLSFPTTLSGKTAMLRFPSRWPCLK